MAADGARTAERDEQAADLRSVQEVTSLARRMYGGDPRRGGVIHPTAVWHPAADSAAVDSAADEVCYQVLKITGETPTSHHDAFALNLARARADAIVTTGKNLRLEDQLTHDFLGSAATRTAMAAWRREARAKTEAPWSLVLTSGRDLDLDHPLFASAGRAVIFTGEDAAKKLEAAAKKRQIRVVADPLPDIRRAVAWLQRQGRGTISIEAGPGSSRDLYRHTRMVDELLLTVYRGPLPESLRGGEFLTVEEVQQTFRYRSAEYTVETEDGLWSFRLLG